MTPVDRRAVLRLGIPAALAALGVQPVTAEPIDGKGNDVCPCFFGVDEAALAGDGTIEVSGPCAVADPPETVTVDVRVSGDRGARAVGATSFDCTGGPDDEDRFSVSASIRGRDRFDTRDLVTVHARVRIDPDEAPTVVGKWNWSGNLS